MSPAPPAIPMVLLAVSGMIFRSAFPVTAPAIVMALPISAITPLGKGATGVVLIDDPACKSMEFPYSSTLPPLVAILPVPFKVTPPMPLRVLSLLRTTLSADAPAFEIAALMAIFLNALSVKVVGRPSTVVAIASFTVMSPAVPPNTPQATPVQLPIFESSVTSVVCKAVAIVLPVTSPPTA